MTEALPYLHAGDIVVLQAEYANYFEETCNAETMPKLMAATDWRYATRLSAAEWKAVLAGMPMLALSHLKRLLLYPFRKSFDTPVPQDHYAYTAAGFNAYGDEVRLPPQSMTLPDSLAFDSGYHLNAQGVDINTRKITFWLARNFPTSGRHNRPESR